jgi:glycosyltransferase involved in cell wall biosynthesis
MSEARATVAIIPRERFSHTHNTLQSVLKNTNINYDLIYVDGKTPDPVNERIIHDLEQADAIILKTESYITPNQARNLALKAAKTEYIVFIDNDVLVGPRWLEALVNCADETGATQVGPLQFIGDFKQQTIHIAGGYLHDRIENNQKVLYDEQKLFEAKLKSLEGPLQRTACDYIEYHCMLIRRDFLEDIDGLDEQLLSVHEHIDLGLELRRQNKSVYFEPKALATYVPPRVSPWYDLPYFEIRWSEEWTLPSVKHFREKWDYDRLGYAGEDESSNLIDDTIVKFVRGHRGSVAGTHVDADSLDLKDGLSAAELELIVTAFLTVERTQFDVQLNGDRQSILPAFNKGSAAELFQYFDDLVNQITLKEIDLDIYPLAANHAKDPCLIRVQQLSYRDMLNLAEHAFLVLKMRNDSYECWFAVSLSGGSTPAETEEFAARVGAQLADTVSNRAISINTQGSASLRLEQLNSGQILTETAFTALRLQACTSSMFVVGLDAEC